MRLFYVLLFFSYTLTAQKVEFTPECKSAYNLLISLKLEKGIELLRAEKIKSPQNIIPIYLENYYYFFSLVTSESENNYKIFQQEEIQILRKIDQIPDNSAYKLFLKSEVLLQWSLIHFRFGNFTDGFINLRKAYISSTENKIKFPNFKLNEKSLGVINILLGSVPEQHKWALRFLKMNGEISTGIRYLKELAEYENHIYKTECELLYAFLTLNLSGKKDEALMYLKEKNHPLNGNLMSYYVYSFLCTQTFQSELAIKTIEKRPLGSEYISFPYFDYLLGISKLYKGDKDASKYLLLFCKEFKGKSNIKASWQKIGWQFLLKGDTSTYLLNKINIKNNGSSILDIDKQAQKEGESLKIPNVNILKARLLYDGGYFKDALQILSNIDIKSLNTEEDRSEYHYRIGKVYFAIKDTISSITNFKLAIEKGGKINRYFAAYSSYELGNIYRYFNRINESKYYYKLCLTFPKHEYSNTIEQKAKLSIESIKSKL